MCSSSFLCFVSSMIPQIDVGLVTITTAYSTPNECLLSSTGDMTCVSIYFFLFV